MEIRRATLEDAALISDLNQDVQRLHAQSLPGVFKQPCSETFPDGVVVEMMGDPENFFFLAIEDEKPVGYLLATLQHRPENSMMVAMDFLSVEQISVMPEARCKGYGRRLLAKAADLARDLGIPRLSLSVWSFNTQAHQLYETFGFRDVTMRMWMDLEQS